MPLRQITWFLVCLVSTCLVDWFLPLILGLDTYGLWTKLFGGFVYKGMGLMDDSS